jgi:hypothetical protein
MALSVSVIPGYQFSEAEKITQTKLNQLGRPTIALEGTINAALIPPGSITSDKLAPGLISGLSEADPAKGDWMMFEDISEGGLRRATIGDILALSTPSLPLITEVGFGDTAWIIQGGDNKQATIGDLLRQSINGQTPITTAAGVDKVADMLLLWDATAPAGSNPNRKVSVVNAVTPITSTLIEDAPALVGTIDRLNDEVLLRDASQPAGSQQVRAKLIDLLAQVGGIKAWARINANLTSSAVTGAWNSGNDLISTPAAHNLAPGDFIWFNTSNAQAPVTAFTAYYVFPVSTTVFQLYTTRDAALAQNAAMRVHIPVDNATKQFIRWATNPILASANISAFIRTTSNANDPGRYKVYFDTPLVDSLYAVQLTGSNEAGTNTNNHAPIACLTAPSAPATTYFTMEALDTDDKYQDPDYLSILVIR